MSRAIITESKLTAIADAIRAKTGGTQDLTVDEMASEIGNIDTDGKTSGIYKSSDSTIYYRYGESWAKTGSGCFVTLRNAQNNADFVFNPSSRQNSCRFIVRFKMTENQLTNYPSIFGTLGGDDYPELVINPSEKVFVTFGTNGRYLAYTFVHNVWYYMVAYNNGAKSYYSLYSDSGELLEQINVNDVNMRNSNYAVNIGGKGVSGSKAMFRGEIDMSQLLFEIDGVAVWGSTNSKTANMGIIEQGGNNQ